MKKLLLFVFILCTVSSFSAQVIVAGVSPQNIVMNYTHTWADPAGGWGTPDFNIPGTFVEDTLMIVDDGSTGTNAQGNPISAEGCNPLINDLTGKIAVIYRNTCEFGAKAFNAQTSGAVGVIIINRNPNEWINMGAGAQGVNVTIPVVMLDLNDGQALVAEMLNGP
ncbi:MAG: PA domain-containing protein, partial [Bacteroidota bacterium]